MLDYPPIFPLPAPRPQAERRKNTRQRDVVARGVAAGDTNVLAGVEYLQSRGIDAQIIQRVLLQLLARRSARPDTSVSTSPAAPHANTQ